ncbi:hypothetical protein KCH_58550 [Kitasatospora cheerisanensis KCTC 2395]|uniref:Uncharacterized protein n=1 Tax=Kitasatospora cheerisanensis KCTC 2395 TaxID=1348663 RepID=A0A066YLK4_9ACTN|nr:hypothetical protein KCH_58550 [Kitasatospora cheerisanensis KCTC 2395]
MHGCGTLRPIVRCGAAPAGRSGGTRSPAPRRPGRARGRARKAAAAPWMTWFHHSGLDQYGVSTLRPRAARTARRHCPMGHSALPRTVSARARDGPPGSVGAGPGVARRAALARKVRVRSGVRRVNGERSCGIRPGIAGGRRGPCSAPEVRRTRTRLRRLNSGTPIRFPATRTEIDP